MNSSTHCPRGPCPGNSMIEFSGVDLTASAATGQYECRRLSDSCSGSRSSVYLVWRFIVPLSGRLMSARQDTVRNSWRIAAAAADRLAEASPAHEGAGGLGSQACVLWEGPGPARAMPKRIAEWLKRPQADAEADASKYPGCPSGRSLIRLAGRQAASRNVTPAPPGADRCARQGIGTQSRGRSGHNNRPPASLRRPAWINAPMMAPATADVDYPLLARWRSSLSRPDVKTSLRWIGSFIFGTPRPSKGLKATLAGELVSVTDCWTTGPSSPAISPLCAARARPAEAKMRRRIRLIHAGQSTQQVSANARVLRTTVSKRWSTVR